MATTHSGGLIAELSRRATREGGNTGVWPGLTIYRLHFQAEILQASVVRQVSSDRIERRTTAFRQGAADESASIQQDRDIV